jgi:hypothetical protein
MLAVEGEDTYRNRGHHRPVGRVHKHVQEVHVGGVTAAYGSLATLRALFETSPCEAQQWPQHDGYCPSSRPYWPLVTFLSAGRISCTSWMSIRIP